jgi:hypothetical protein
MGGDSPLEPEERFARHRQLVARLGEVAHPWRIKSAGSNPIAARGLGSVWPRMAITVRDVQRPKRQHLVLGREIGRASAAAQRADKPHGSLRRAHLHLDLGATGGQLGLLCDEGL